MGVLPPRKAKLHDTASASAATSFVVDSSSAQGFGLRGRDSGVAPMTVTLARKPLQAVQCPLTPSVGAQPRNQRTPRLSTYDEAAGAALWGARTWRHPRVNSPFLTRIGVGVGWSAARKSGRRSPRRRDVADGPRAAARVSAPAGQGGWGRAGSTQTDWMANSRARHRVPGATEATPRARAASGEASPAPCFAWGARSPEATSPASFPAECLGVSPAGAPQSSVGRGWAPKRQFATVAWLLLLAKAAPATCRNGKASN